jgi:hypothetical protein
MALPGDFDTKKRKPPAALAGGGLDAAGVAESFSSGSDSRAHVVAANSNCSNGNGAADAVVVLRFSVKGEHDVDESRPEASRMSQENRPPDTLSSASFLRCAMS